MGRIHEVAPFEKQDKLEENLFKTKEGNYVKITTSRVLFEGEDEITSLTQDKLEEGLIRILNGSYFHIDSIEEVEEGECFVATAVYGDINAQQVRTLRGVRDKVLEPNKLGRALIDIYYGGFGRKAADFLRERPLAINLIRNGLDFAVRRYSPDL